MAEDNVKKKQNYRGLALFAIIPIAWVVAGFLGVFGTSKNYTERRVLERTAAVSKYENTLRDSACLDSLAREVFHAPLERVPSLEMDLKASFGNLEDSLRNELEIARISPEVIRYEEIRAEDTKFLIDSARRVTWGIYLGLASTAVLCLGYLLKERHMLRKPS